MLLVLLKGKSGKFPTQYLGALLYSGCLTIRMLDAMVMNIRNKVASWKGKLLSQGGRLILIRHVLSCMPYIHLLLLLFHW